MSGRGVGTARADRESMTGREAWGRLVVLIVLALGCLAAAAIVDRDSAQRANRLFDEGRHSDAAALYRQGLEERPGADALHYNLGTALLHLGNPTEAGTELARALDARDSAVAFGSHHNLGYHALVGALSHPALDSALAFARAAERLNRQAVRLAPDSESARWNLALSQRALDSLLWVESGLAQEEVQDSLDNAEPDLANAAMLRDLQGEGSLGGQFFSQGEREALARDLAASPLSADEANDFLTGLDQRPASVLRRIFLLASPNRWGNFVPASRRTW